MIYKLTNRLLVPLPPNIAWGILVWDHYEEEGYQRMKEPKRKGYLTTERIRRSCILNIILSSGSLKLTQYSYCTGRKEVYSHGVHANPEWSDMYLT